jgi:hypothetical protein
MSARHHNRFVGVHIRFSQCAPPVNDTPEKDSCCRSQAPGRNLGVGPLNSIIRRIKIRSLRERLAFRQLKCAALANKFESADLTTKQKVQIARHWEDTLKESHTTQLAIDLLEREEKIERSGIDSLVSGN